MALPTPDTLHLSRPEYATVYEPAEDTYLLLDALEKDRAELQALQPQICVEIGSGSGCVSAFLGQVLAPIQSLIISTDINPAANQATQETTAAIPSMAFEQCRTRFVQALDNRLQGNIDVLIFNPPYVVTPSSEIDVTAEASAWAGGAYGREVLDQLLPQIHTLLSQNGRFYLVVIEENKPEEIIGILAQHSLVGCRVLQRRAGRENLSILRFIRK
ncbi:HemK methyltransferase member 2 [Coemansia brasiliensis]|uniref:HemK methyltransferase member 2 n=1 Tax=Coemansia brasiliensis TaxID=2650707 RepID=A0A9W8M0A3_9FUNG|nr:HemK methyltransferase member 2 [Coemansia brasiliensis]